TARVSRRALRSSALRLVGLPGAGLLVATLVLLTVLIAALLLTGCTVGPDYKRPALPVPPDFRGLTPDTPGGAESIGDIAWWKIFQDETLQSLIHTAIAANYDLQIATARILEARAQVTIVRSFQFPDVTGSASAQYVSAPGDRPPLVPREAFSPFGALNLIWEIDLWGRLRRATEAARAELLASQDTQQFVLITLIADVATAYFQLRELDKELEISRRPLATRQEQLRLLTLRYQGGLAAVIDVRQAEVLVYTAAATTPDIERRIEQTENFISVLLGRNPAAVPRGRPLLQQFSGPVVPPGLPSSLLERRPDIRQAESQLAAATARIGVATADYFPRVFLTGSAGGGRGAPTRSQVGPPRRQFCRPPVALARLPTGRGG